MLCPKAPESAVVPDQVADEIRSYIEQSLIADREARFLESMSSESNIIDESVNVNVNVNVDQGQGMAEQSTDASLLNVLPPMVTPEAPLAPDSRIITEEDGFGGFDEAAIAHSTAIKTSLSSVSRFLPDIASEESVATTVDSFLNPPEPEVPQEPSLSVPLAPLVSSLVIHDLSYDPGSAGAGTGSTVIGAEAEPAGVPQQVTPQVVANPDPPRHSHKSRKHKSKSKKHRHSHRSDSSSSSSKRREERKDRPSSAAEGTAPSGVRPPPPEPAPAPGPVPAPEPAPAPSGPLPDQSGSAQDAPIPALSLPDSSGQSAILLSLVEAVASIKAQVAALQAGATAPSQADGAPVSTQNPGLMDPANLPSTQAARPWVSAVHAPIADGYITLEHYGTRLISDFETCPQGAAIPNCYVRIKSDKVEREDKVVKDPIAVPKEKAQAALFMFLKDTGAINTKKATPKGTYTIFTVNPSSPNPIMDKLGESVFRSYQEKRPVSSLREIEPVSLVLPQDAGIWSNMAASFFGKPLSATAPGELLDNTFPNLPDNLVKAEHSAKARLERSTSGLSQAEQLKVHWYDNDTVAALVKTLAAIFFQDLVDYIEAKRNCRLHVLKPATIRIEPSKLIDASIWGEDLFPKEVVQEVKENAAKAAQSLAVRWGIPLSAQTKRKAEQESRASPTPKKARSSRKGHRRGPSPFFPMPGVQMTPQGYHSPHHPQPFQSPAHNPRYESGYTSFRPYHRGGRGRGVRKGKKPYFGKGFGRGGGRGGGEAGGSSGAK